MSNLDVWNRKSKEINGKVRIFYKLAFFKRNLRQRMLKCFNEGLEIEGFELILMAWKIKLDGMKMLINEDKYFKIAEQELLMWETRLEKAKKHPSLMKRTDWVLK